MPKNSCIMQIWAEPKKSALPICNYSQILYRFLTFTQNLKRSLVKRQLHFCCFYGHLLDFFCHFLKMAYFNKTSLLPLKMSFKKLKIRHFSAEISVLLFFLFESCYAVYLYSLPLPVTYFLQEHLMFLYLSTF